MISKTNSTFDLGASTVPDLIQEKIKLMKEKDLHIAIPATITDVSDYETMQCVSVKPVIDDVYLDDDIVRSVNIKKVFVKLQGGGGFRIKLPVAVGNKCTLCYSHKSLDKFLDGNGDNVEQPVGWIPSIRDCWVELGFGTRSNNYNPSQTNLIIEGPSTNITITPSGQVTIVTSGDITTTTTGNSHLTATQHTVDAQTTTFNSPTTIINGNTTINGNLGVAAGSGGGGTATIPNIVVSDSLQAGGDEVINHDHGGVESGPSRTNPLGS